MPDHVPHFLFRWYRFLSSLFFRSCHVISSHIIIPSDIPSARSLKAHHVTSSHPSPSIMPKTQPKSNGVKRTKNDMLTEHPKCATRKPHRYRQDKHSQAASSNESHIISDSDDSRQTLEARIRALESVITNHANMTKNMKQPEPTAQDPLPSTLQFVQHSHSKNRTRDHQQNHSTSVSTTDDELPAEMRKKKRAKKAIRLRKSHDHSSTDSSTLLAHCVLPLYSNNDLVFVYCKPYFCFGWVRASRNR